MSSGIREQVIYSVTRIRSSFRDGIGNLKVGTGTGFWIISDAGACFVTNQHNVDPEMKLGGGYTLEKLEIEFRDVDRHEDFTEHDTVFLEVLSHEKILSNKADLVILYKIKCGGNTDKYNIAGYITKDNLADEDFFETKTKMMDVASFFGFPGKSGQGWWDERANFSIARVATLSSLTDGKYRNSAIQSEDIVLVSGMSFSGSSGSPIILHSKDQHSDFVFISGQPIKTKLIEAKVIGIMAGHYDEVFGTMPDMLVHTGLSYFVRSTSILDLIEKAEVAFNKSEQPKASSKNSGE